MRRRQRRTALACLVTAALLTATACAPPDLGPLPPRYSGPPLSADTAVSEMRSALAAEGVVVEREPSGGLGRCLERLSGRHAPETVDAALKSAFGRARSEYGWQTGPDMGSRTLTLTKGNWTVTAGLPVKPAQGIQAPVIMSLICLDGSSTPAAADPAPPNAA
ncbi:hypothetical protein [Streptomyces sp. WG7]|uniref:hypothetical protein n=1 Tax=Streptomyces sp. WG7 TaxID=3417650 RepID=UPI003CF2FD8B